MSHTPLAERRAPSHAQSGDPAQVHTPLAGRRGAGTRFVERTGAGAHSLTGGAWPIALCRTDRRVHAPSREARGRSRFVGRTGGCTLPHGRRVADRALSGGPAGARSLAGGAWPIALCRADRRVHAPSREARGRSRFVGRTGGCTLPCGRRVAGHAVLCRPARVHTPLREARNKGCPSQHGPHICS